MILDLTPAQIAFRSTVEAFARDVVAPRAAEIDSTDAFPLDVIHAAGEQGLMGITIPTAWGGRGLDYLSYVLAIETIAQASANRCFCPPLNLPTREPRFSSSWTSRMTSSTVRPRS